MRRPPKPNLHAMSFFTKRAHRQRKPRQRRMSSEELRNKSISTKWAKKRGTLRIPVFLRWILGKCPLLSKMSGHLSKMDGHLSKRSGADTKRSGCHICSRHAYPADKCPIPHSPRERRVRRASAQIVRSKRRLGSLFYQYAAPR